MPAILNDRDLSLSGPVGVNPAWGLEDGFSAADVTEALAQIGDGRDLTLRINSGGGIATEGSAIHAALARHKGRKRVIVEGIAASAASIIAMAGDEIIMSLGALLMIHDPSGFTVGTIAEHQSQINSLTALADSMASIYSAKSGRTVADCRKVMVAETWMTADEAVTQKFADRIEGAPRNGTPSAFAYNRYRRAPTALRMMATENNWSLDRKKIRDATAPNALSVEEIRSLVAKASRISPNYFGEEDVDVLVRMGATEAQAYQRLFAKIAEATDAAENATAARSMSRDNMLKQARLLGLKS